MTLESVAIYLLEGVIQFHAHFTSQRAESQVLTSAGGFVSLCYLLLWLTSLTTLATQRRSSEKAAECQVRHCSEWCRSVAS